MSGGLFRHSKANDNPFERSGSFLKEDMRPPVHKKHHSSFFCYGGYADPESEEEGEYNMTPEDETNVPEDDEEKRLDNSLQAHPSTQMAALKDQKFRNEGRKLFAMPTLSTTQQSSGPREESMLAGILKKR